MPLTGSVSASNVFGFNSFEAAVIQNGVDPLKMGTLYSLSCSANFVVAFTSSENSVIQNCFDPLNIGVLQTNVYQSASVDTLKEFKSVQSSVIQGATDPVKMDVLQTNAVRNVYGVSPKFDMATAYVISSYRLGGTDTLISTATQSISEGFPAPPSLQLNGKQAFSFLWKMEPATHSIQAMVKQARNLNASTRPSIYIPQNQPMGITGSLEVFAASGSQGWVAIGPIELVISNAGGIYVELRSNAIEYQNNPCYWDNIVLS